MRSLISCCVVVALLASALGCTRKSRSDRGVVPPQDIIEGVGSIEFLEIEGGFYAIVSDDGATYDPQSLPDGFMTDGIRVHFTVRILWDRVGFHQVGPIVEVLQIRQLE